MAGFGNYLEAMIVNASLRGGAFTVPAAHHIGIFSADPTDDGNVNEFAYAGYARQDVTNAWSAPSGVDNQTTNAAQIIFPANSGVADIVVTHFAIFDAATAGNCLYSGALSAPRTIIPGDQIAFAAGQVTIKPDTV
jgi:hypothetical protein